MQNRSFPSFLGAKRAGAALGDALGWMDPSSSTITCICAVPCLDSVWEEREKGLEFGIMIIPWSTEVEGDSVCGSARLALGHWMHLSSRGNTVDGLLWSSEQMTWHAWRSSERSRVGKFLEKTRWSGQSNWCEGYVKTAKVFPGSSRGCLDQLQHPEQMWVHQEVLELNRTAKDLQRRVRGNLGRVSVEASLSEMN